MGYVNCKQRYVHLIESLELEYSASWKEAIFDLNKVGYSASSSGGSFNTNH